MTNQTTDEAAVEWGEGWVFFNPDAGEEYASQHPISSGEVPDAENVRKSTAMEDHLRAQLTAATRRAEQAERMLAALSNRKQFPILGSQGQTVDFQLVADHGKQAKSNHYQTVERLAERGGLAWCELYAVVHNKSYQKLDENSAMIACRALEARYLAAIRSAASGEQG